MNEQLPPPKLINPKHRHQRRRRINAAGNDGGKQRGVGAQPHRLKQHRRVKHDHINPRKLLKHLQNGPTKELRPTRPLHQVPKRVLDHFRSLRRPYNLLVLFPDVVDASGFAEGGEAFRRLPPLNEAGGRLDDEDGAEAEEEGGESGDAEGVSPAVRGDFGGEVIY